MSLTMFKVLLVVVTIHYTLGDVCCPSGSYKLDSKCYQIVPEAQTRSQAATVCNGKDGVVWTYKGCYQDKFMDHDLSEKTLLTNTTGMTPAMCAKHCFRQGYSIMGLRCAKECTCGNTYGKHGTGTCSLPCRGDSNHICGDAMVNSIYHLHRAGSLLSITDDREFQFVKDTLVPHVSDSIWIDETTEYNEKCEHYGNLDISCPSGKVITIHDAFYGRLSSDICSHGNYFTLECSEETAQTTIVNHCAGESSCAIGNSNEYFGNDPCVLTNKYTTTLHACLSIKSSSASEASMLLIPVRGSTDDSVGGIAVCESTAKQADCEIEKEDSPCPDDSCTEVGMHDFPGKNVVRKTRHLVVLVGRHGVFSEVSGVVVGWNVFTENNNAFTLGMWRKIGTDQKRAGRNIFKFIGGKTVHFDTTGDHTLMLEASDQFAVQAGDMIGLSWTTSQAVPFVVFDCEIEDGEMVSPVAMTHGRVDEIEVGTERSFGVHPRRTSCQKYRVQAIIRNDNI